MRVDPETASLYLAAIVESSDDAILAKDRTGIVTSWNRAAERLFGYTADEVLGRSIRLIVPPDREHEEDEVLARIWQGATVEHLETVRRRKDGALVPVSLTVSPIRNAAGDVIGASTIARDITDRKAQEQALAEAEARQVDLQQRLLALVAGSRSLLVSPRVEDVLPAILGVAREVVRADAYAVWRLDAGSRSWRVGASAGLSDAFVGHAVSFPPAAAGVPFEGPLAVADVAREPLLEDRVAAYRAEGIASMVAVPVVIGTVASGTIVFYYRVRHVATEVDLQVMQALANLASATITTAELYDAQRRSRAQSEFLAETGALLAGSLEHHESLKKVADLAVPHLADWCAVDLLNEKGEIERVAVAHVDPAKIEMARQLERAYPADPGSPFSVSHVVRSGTPVLIHEVTEEMLVRGARSAEHLAAIRALDVTSVMCVPLVAHGRTLGALTFVSAESRRRYSAGDLQFAQDVASRAALAVDNARAYAELQRANRLKDDFLATFSHELRTPLNAILGYSRMLRSGMMPEARRARAYEVLDKNAAALTQIVEDVLDVSRIVSGKIRLDVQPVDLPPLLEQCVETVRPAADAKGVRVQTLLDPRAAPVAGDPERLQQVVWNLLSNAVKFTPRGGRIQVRLERGDSQVDIVVSDTGVGIDPAFLPHMFERFRQADSRFAREHGGLGLGLAIARHIVEMHGGTLTATSEGVGQGATFRVHLPVMIVHADPLGRRPHGAPAPPGGGALTRLDGVHVLAVDDEQDALMLLKEILTLAGATVTTAASGEEALANIELLAPDVLLSDIGMPTLDGFQFIEMLRAMPSAAANSVPAAALTAYARSEDRTRALRAGFQMHLAKPIDPGELLAAVRSLAHRPAPSPTTA